MPWWFYDLECNSRLWIVPQIWYKSLSFKTIMMPRYIERNWRILFVTLNFVNVGMPVSDFMIMSAIIDFELSLKYDIWTYVLKLLRCLHDPNELTDIICPIKFRKCWAASVILKKTTFCKCWDASMILWSWVQL